VRAARDTSSLRRCRMNDAAYRCVSTRAANDAAADAADDDHHHSCVMLHLSVLWSHNSSYSYYVIHLRAKQLQHDRKYYICQ